MLFSSVRKDITVLISFPTLFDSILSWFRIMLSISVRKEVIVLISFPTLFDSIFAKRYMSADVAVQQCKKKRYNSEFVQMS